MKAILIKNKTVILALFFLFSNFKAGLSQDFENIPAAIHVQSKVSDGKFFIEQIADLARKDGIRVVVITDTLLRRWEYTPWPFIRILKREYEEASVIRFGVHKYLQEISDVQKKFPDMLIIAGAEVAPFYFWKGSYLNKSLELRDWHKKILVLGLENAKDYRYLPVVASYWRLPQHLNDWLNFWPIGMISLGIVLTKIRRRKRFSFGEQLYSTPSEPFKKTGYFLIILGAVLLIRTFRFPLSEYDPYHGNQGIKPYQNLIDYVNRKNGLTFWTHPEASLSSSFAGARVITPAYKSDLIRSKYYTGFAGIYYDNTTATKPGDLWDRTLEEYCSGKRQRPVWIFGEVGWDGTKEQIPISGIETILLLKDFNQSAALTALHSGKMYAKLNIRKNSFSLDKFCILDERINIPAFMGDDLRIYIKPKIIIKASFKGQDQKETSFKLIKDGLVIKEFKAKAQRIAVAYKDNNYSAEKKSFYRLQIDNEDLLILTNPIFVSSKD